MKIAKKDLALVMIIVALLAAFAAYKFSLSANLDAVDDEEAKQASLQAQIDEVKARADQVPKMEKEIADWQTNVADWIKPFHSAHLYEDGIMYLRNLEHQDEKEKDPFKAFILAYQLNETGINTSVSGQGSFSGQEFTSGTAVYDFEFRLTGYDELKNFFSYIISEVDGFGVKSLDSIAFDLEDGSDIFRGTVSMTAYAIAEIDNGKLVNPYVPQNLTDVEQGIEAESIFGNFKEEGEDDKKDNE